VELTDRLNQLKVYDFLL